MRKWNYNNMKKLYIQIMYLFIREYISTFGFFFLFSFCQTIFEDMMELDVSSKICFKMKDMKLKMRLQDRSKM